MIYGIRWRYGMEFRISRRRHPLGFIQYNARLGRLVFSLHAWKAKSADPIIHDHRFTFLSLVIWGTTTEQTWRVVSGDTHYLLDVPPRGTPLDETRRPVALAVGPLNYYCPGQILKCRRGDFHRIIEHPRVTLLAKWLPPGRTFSHVVIERD
jgi:hypothetical protein